MSRNHKSRTWRMISALLLLTLLLTPTLGAQVIAAPLNQDSSPESPSAPGDHLVTNISLGPDSPNILQDGSHVNVSFEYVTTQAGGVRIYVRPYTNGSASPGYGAHGSILYPQGSGQGSGWFTINSGEVTVDQIRIRMVSETTGSQLFETFIPVYYQFDLNQNIVTNVNLIPDTPNVLGFTQRVNLRFNYSNVRKEGVLIYFRPYTQGSLTPHYSAHGSQIYPAGTGSGSAFFTINSGTVVVDHIRVQMWNPDQTILLFEAFLPVYYRFMSSTNIVSHINIFPDTPNVFKYSQNVNFTFNYSTNYEAGVRIWVRPFSGTSLSPNYGAHGSNIYPVGTGGGDGYFNLKSGPTLVDKVRVQMWDPDHTTLLYEAFLPVHLSWEGAGPPPGPDMSIDAMEVTQAVQDLNNSVDLVARKQTYVRVHVSSPVNVNDVYATLTGKRGGMTLYPILSPGNPGGDITVSTSPDRGQINDSFWFELPESWTAAGNLTLTAKLDPNNVVNDVVQGDNTKTITLNFKSTPPLRLRLVNVQYTFGGNTYLAANSHLNALESWLRRAYPINDLQVNRQTFVYPSSGLPNVDTLHGWLAMAKMLRIIFSGEDSRVVYYGMVDDGGDFMRGKSAGIPATIAAGPTGTGTWGWDFDGSYGDWYGGHEIGHTRGRYHAEYCGAGGGVSYPYTGGRISPALTGNTALYGFDITTRDIYTPDWKDVMTYCDNEWVSDFTYEGIRSYLTSVGLRSAAPLTATASQFLAIVETADLDSNTATLESIYLIDQEETLDLPDPGDWTIALLDNADTDLATYPFAPDELTDSEESPGSPAVIAEIVPWTAGTEKVEIRYLGETVASRSASENAPTVNILTPTDGSNLSPGPFTVTWDGSDQDGDSLNYSVLYSYDGGTSWETLATNLLDTSLELNTDQLPGGSAQLRVVASDGFLTGQDTSGTFTVPLHAPDVQILLPEEDEVFFATQQVTLQGTAYDLEDGSLGGESFAWSSDIDGFLGTGATFKTNLLTTGTHLITLEVTDSDAMSTEVTRSIVISDSEAPEPLNLDAAPTGIGLVVGLGDPAQTYTVTLRSSSSTEMDWEASSDAAWLGLHSSSGTTPSDLVLDIDPSTLGVGSYSAKLTITSSSAGNSPIDIPVSLQVTGNVIYLPFVTTD